MNHVKPYRVPNGLFVLLFALAAFQVNAQVKISNSGPGQNTVFFPGSNLDGIGHYYDLGSKVVHSTDGGLVKGTALVPYTNPSGNPLALTATARAPAAAVGAALGKFAVKASGVGAVLGAGIALYDLAKELDYIFDNSTGALVVQKIDTSICTVAPCYSYFTDPAHFYFKGGTGSTPATACAAGIALAISRGNEPVSYHSSTINSCLYVVARTGNISQVAMGRTSVTPAPSNTTPSTLANFQDAAAAKTSWPANSNISRTLDQAQNDYDIFVEFNPPTVTGPASTPGKTSTTTSSTGTTTTSTTTHNHTYDGATVNTSNVTVTNVTNNAGDTTTTTTTETPVKEEPTPDQCEKNPDSIGCSEFGTPEPQQLTQKSIAVQLTPVTFASSATCPANVSASFTVMGRSFSPSFSYAPICAAATDYIRPVMLLLALAASAFIFVGGLKSGS